ncbi:hypothetical protein SAMN05444673_2615 [Bacillus sp. OV166]|uniref:hypothetical protein n=1 Tax=Bacillus sp. OV166 TaxID=1882763 RepID=UPI000A2AE505|nr:hypothetical protein [Bacillus sp. OV166]SMQ76015.1 hypothetical protein SAMN05444673_2615 [Bacillus sp. OV166]
MKRIKLSDYINVVKPSYVYLRLTPNNSIRNQSTHKIAKSIASIYRNITQNIKKEDAKVIKFLNKEFLFGTKYSYEMNSKVSYYVYIEKKKVEFYFIIPKRHLSLIKEKISDSWTNITVKEVKGLPNFSESATKYQLVYSKENALSLATDRRNDDLLRSKLNVVDVMNEGDKVGVFYNFIPTTQFSWRSSYESTIKKVKRNLPTERNKVGTAYILKMLIGIVSGLFDDLGEVLSGSKKKVSDENVFEALIERLNGGKKISDATSKKATATVLNAQIVVMSESKDKLSERNNARSLAQSFETITEDNRLVAKPLRKSFKFTDYSIAGSELNKVGDEEAQNFIALAGRDILERYNFIEKVETQETEVPEDLRSGVMCVGESTFRGAKQKAYLSNYEHYRNLLTLLIGPTRAGKSNLIGNLSIDSIENGECVIIFDFIKNCELSDEISALFPKEKVLNIDNSDPAQLQGLGYNEVGYTSNTFAQYENAKRQTANLLALINAINVDESRLSPKMERYLEAAALVVFINTGSIRDVFRVLQNHNSRHDYLSQVPKAQFEFMEEYMTSLEELDEIKDDVVVGTKLNLIVGIIDRLSILKRNTQMELMLKRDMDTNINLVEEMQKNQVICIRMPESKFPTEGERDIATTYWITKIWLALQIRADKIRDYKKQRKVNLVIDEIYQVENTEKFIEKKLSQIAKFICKPIISCHYINQLKHLRKELRSANTSYMLIAGCDEDNYKELKAQLYPFTAEDLANMKPYHAMNYVKCRDGYSRFITKLPGKVEDRIKRKQKEAEQCKA